MSIWKEAKGGLIYAVACLAVVCAAGTAVEWLDEQPVVEEAPPVVIEEPEEDPMEAEKIEEALIEQGYFREDVPMDYDLQDILFTLCDDLGIPREIGLGLIDVESDFNPDAVSPNGCYGLCQLNPRYFPSGLSSADNIRTGIAYLGEKLEKYNGDMAAALTAYNAGHDTGKRFYSSKVMAAAEYWREG